MIEADFSESQLQQLVNISLVEKYKLEEALVLAPILISLNAENKEGWDTAFNLKWLKKNTSKCHEGCNFFIQYKISNVLTSSGANEWKDWERDYFRFKIPHKKKNSVGKYVDNYNQFNNLVGIAAKGFTVYYATNSTTDRKQLIQSFKTNKLLDTTPFLDVSDISGAHKHVTFTSDSTYFLLHSERQRISKSTISRDRENMYSKKIRTMAESSRSLLDYLSQRQNGDDGMVKEVESIRKYVEDDESGFTKEIKVQMRLSHVFRTYFDLEMHWISKENIV